MKLTVLHRLYKLLMLIALPGVILRLFWRARKNPGYALRIPERFGFYKEAYRTGGWVIHAVSVGETVAAAPLVEALLAGDPQALITVTSTTPTGSARVRALFGNRVQHLYLPYDYPGAVRRFLKALKPRAVIVMETEWWPNLFTQTKQAGLPLALVNARLSERSLKGYERIKTLSLKMAECLTLVCAQTEQDAAHFIRLGVPADRVQTTGNLKFDCTVDEQVRLRAQELKAGFAGRPVWVAASTHAGEEALVIETIRQILSACPQALAVVVPRHPERFAAFYESLCQAGLNVARRSQNEPVGLQTQVYLGDTMGELMLLYGAAEVAFVAGSFVDAGGHNMLEAALMGAAIVMGPHLENVSVQAQALIAAGGMISVQSPEALAETIIHWFKNPVVREACVKQAQNFIESNRGAVQRTLASIEEKLK